jgi:hypothetical protein
MTEIIYVRNKRPKVNPQPIKPDKVRAVVVVDSKLGVVKRIRGQRP